MPKENEQKKNSTLDLLKNYCNSLIGLSAVRYNTPLPDLIEHFKIASDLSEEDMAILYNFFDNLTGYCPNSDKQKDSLTFLFKNILIYTSQTASGHKNLIAFLKKQLNENFKTTIKTREFLKDIPSLKTFLESANLISKPIQTLLTALNPKKEEKNISDERIMLINSFGSDLYPWAFNSLMENIKNITEQEDQEFITKISTQDEQPDKTIKILAYLTPAQFKTWFLILFDQKASINNMLAILYKQQLQTLFSYLNGKASENTETLLELITNLDKNSSENVIKKLSELNTQTPNKDTSIVLNIVNDELKYCNKLFIPFLDQITELEKSIQFKLKLVQIKSDKSSGNNRYLATENILNNLQPKKKNFIASFFAPTINLPEEQATFCLNTILSHEVQKIIEKLSNYLDKNPKISIKSLFLFLSTTELSHKNIGEIFSSLISLDGKCFDRAISKIIKLNVEKLQKPNNTFDGGDENCLIKKINNIINKMSPPLQAIPSIQ